MRSVTMTSSGPSAPVTTFLDRTVVERACAWYYAGAYDRLHGRPLHKYPRHCRLHPVSRLVRCAPRSRNHRTGGRSGSLRAQPVLSPGATRSVVSSFETYGPSRSHHHRRVCLAGRLGSSWPGSPPSQGSRRKRCRYRRSQKTFSLRSSSPNYQARLQCDTLLREHSRDGFE